MRFEEQLPYHTALKHGSEKKAPPRDRVEARAGTAFVHDIRSGLPAAYEACDVLYSEIPWPAGFVVFEQRAGKAPGASFKTFVKAVRDIVQSEHRLTVLLVGQAALRGLPVPEQRMDIKLNGGLATVVTYHDQIPAFPDSYSLLHWLAEHFDCVGDFCCGYGTSGAIFEQHGKRWIMSDHNAHCIGYIGETFSLTPT
jgi:hypothetical protein